MRNCRSFIIPAKPSLSYAFSIQSFLFVIKIASNFYEIWYLKTVGRIEPFHIFDFLEERRFQLRRDGSLRSHMNHFICRSYVTFPRITLHELTAGISALI